jgi:aminocarboxymuconate-semialdehyde decarboxylase
VSEDQTGAAPGKPDLDVVGPVVDVHAHALPMPLLRQLADAGLADLSGLAERVLVLDPAISGLAPGAPIPLPTEQYEMSSRIRSMDEMGVTYQAVSAPPFVFATESGDERLVMEITRRSNDALAEFVSESGGRLAALATLPVGVPGAATELARCMDDLGFAGATIGTFGGGRELDDPCNEELWAELSARRCFLLMHPSRASSPGRLADYHLVQLLGYPAETALAASRLIFGGVLDRHDLVLCLAHGGGCLPAVGPRLDLGWRQKAAAGVIPAAPTEYLRRLRYDTAVFDTTILSRLITDMTVDNVLLGTDAPFDLADWEPLATVRALGLAAPAQQAILGGNAMALLPQLATWPAATVGAKYLLPATAASSISPFERGA